MGYDMYVVDERGQRIDERGDTYLHRNMSGGRRLAEALVDARMGYWSAGYDADRRGPTVPPGVSWLYDEDTGEGHWVGVAAEEFTQQLHAYLSSTWDERPGIAVYKLCGSNDDWWVTKAECRSALDLWERNGHPDFDPIGDVLPFLRVAATHAGFRVG